MPLNTKDEPQLAGIRHQVNEEYKREDEIDLIEIFKILFKRKFLIFAIAAFFTLLSVIYSLVVSPVYKAEAFFFPPALSDVQALNVAWFNGLEKVEIGAVYDVFNRNLKSRSLQRNFFENNGVSQQFKAQGVAGNSDEKLFQEFSKVISVSRDKKNKDNSSLAIEWGDPVIAAQWANGFASIAERETVKYFYTNLNNAVETRTRDIEYTIASKRKIAQQRREDRIVVLEEATSIAKLLNKNEESERVGVIRSISSQPDYKQEMIVGNLYDRGSKALLVEADILRKRKSDDAFIPGLRNLQEELDRLHSININQKELKAATVDQSAYPPEQRIKPKRTLIVILGALLGLMVGVLVAFLVNAFHSYRVNEAAEI